MRKLSVLLMSSVMSSFALADEPPVRVPGSSAEHLFLADSYERQAVEHQSGAEKVRRELSRFLRDASGFPNKTGHEFPWVQKQRQADEGLISKAEERAARARRVAEYHRMRATELSGLELAEAERILGAPAPQPKSPSQAR